MPQVGQNMLITLYDILQYRKRHGGVYNQEKSFLKKNEFLSLAETEKLQELRLFEFLNFCKLNSSYYSNKIELQEGDNAFEALQNIKPISKENIRLNQKDIVTIAKRGAFIGKTGGTTGKSLEVYYLWEDAQRRFAMLDLFRERFGYQFGAKTAWFSGKALLTDRDLTKNRFWKSDYYHKIRYYSTFHMSDKYMEFYIDNLKKYKPKFIVGFPSSIVEIARYGLRNNITPLTSVMAIFPTAESKIESEAKDITAFFGAEVRDQYASSEGANFITECEQGNLHYEMLTGIIEVVGDDHKPAQEGKMLLTSFTTRGTPLIRYDIGDRMRWSTKKECRCGRQTPIVDKILGRINDYIWSPENGKINLGNVSNCVKNITEIVKFQIIQNTEKDLLVRIIKGKKYSLDDETSFMYELKARVGAQMNIVIDYVTEIPNEKSGKYRMIKNHFKQNTK